MSSVITDPPNALFTATSMIGFIAGAGIVVRNSIILVDFIELRLRECLPLEQAVVDACAVRFRPAPWPMAVPVLYDMANRHERTESVPTAAPMEGVSGVSPACPRRSRIKKTGACRRPRLKVTPQARTRVDSPRVLVPRSFIVNSSGTSNARFTAGEVCVRRRHLVVGVRANRV